MASRTQVIVEDDIDGGNADHTIRFTVNGSSYEIDLSAENAQRFDQAMEPFVSKARRVGGRAAGARRPTQSSTGTADQTAIRAWAKDNGYQISDRGRISSSVVAAYKAASDRR